MNEFPIDSDTRPNPTEDASERPLSFAEVLEKALTDYIARENPDLAERLKRS